MLLNERPPDLIRHHSRGIPNCTTMQLQLLSRNDAQQYYEESEAQLQVCPQNAPRLRAAAKRLVPAAGTCSTNLGRSALGCHMQLTLPALCAVHPLSAGQFLGHELPCSRAEKEYLSIAKKCPRGAKTKCATLASSCLTLFEHTSTHLSRICLQGKFSFMCCEAACVDLNIM